MKKRYIFLIWFLALIISFFLDKYLLIIPEFRNPIIDKIMLAISFIGSWIFILIFLVTLLLWEKGKQNYIPVLIISFTVSMFLTYILKGIIPRSRPGINPLEIKQDNSFPSGHATAAFTGVPIINKIFPFFKHFWIVLAILIAFSRLYLGVHYLSDIVAGSLLGYGIATFFMYIENKISFFKKSIFK
jgi:undecaprenyl-diphosphatase